MLCYAYVRSSHMCPNPETNKGIFTKMYYQHKY